MTHGELPNQRSPHFRPARPDFDRANGLAITFSLALLLGVANLVSASPRDELLRLVPDDAGFCFLLDRLREHSDDFVRSPFFKNLADSRFAVSIRSAPEVGKFDDLDKQLRRHFDLSLAQLRDDLLGDAVAFVYRPAPPGQPDREQGMILVHVRDAKLLARLIDRIDDSQKKTGDLVEVQKLRHAGHEYRRRVEKKGPNFLYLHDGLLAASADEDLVKHAIERTARRNQKDQQPSLHARLVDRLGTDGALASVVLNPRAFDAAMEAKRQSARPEELPGLDKFATLWNALDGLAITLNLRVHDLELSLAAAFDENKLPAALRKALTRSAEPVALWRRFPDNALVTMAGRLDGAAWYHALAELLPDDARKSLADGLERGPGAALGRDIVKDVLPFLGPEWGACVFPPSDKDDGAFPHAVAVLGIQPGPDPEHPLDKAARDFLNSAALVGVLAYNSAHQDRLHLKSITRDKVEVKYLVNDKLFPKGFQPALALKDGHLVLASSPDAVFRLNLAGELGKAEPADETPWLRVSFREIRSYLQSRKAALAADIARRNASSEDEAARALDELVARLATIDRLELVERSSRERLAWIVRLRAPQPLRAPRE